MGCLGNSKTEDQRIDEKAQREANKKIEKQLQKERQAYKATHRLLLLGKAFIYGLCQCLYAFLLLNTYPFDSACDMSGGWILMETKPSIQLHSIRKHLSIFLRLVRMSAFRVLITCSCIGFMSKVRVSPEKAPL